MTSAIPSGRRLAEPLKMTSSIVSPRSDPRALLAQGPGHGVADVGLAAAVGPDDGRHGARKGQIHLLVEGLEARDLDAF